MSTHQFNCSCCNPLWKHFFPKGVTLTAPKHDVDETAAAENKIMLFYKEGEKSIITMHDRKPSPVEAMVVHNDKIVFTGDLHHAEQFIDQKLDISQATFSKHVLKDAETIVPGLIDPHMHTLPTALITLFPDAGPFIGQNMRANYDVNFVKSVLSDPEKQTQAWVLAHDVDPSLFTGNESKALNKDVLDEIDTDKPIFTINASQHLAYVNSIGIKRLTEQGFTPSPDGILQEAPEILPALKIVVTDCQNDQTDFNELMLNKVKEIFTTASRRGITTMLDAGVEPSHPGGEGMVDQPQYLSNIVHHPDCPIRLGAALSVESEQDLIEKVLPYYTQGQGDDQFFIPFIKVVSDGSNQGMTGYQYQTYCCDENYVTYTDENSYENTNHGLFNFIDTLNFENLVQRAYAEGWPLMIHANGDQAISRTITAYKKACPAGQSLEKGRNRIEHSSILSDDHLQDMREYGISPSFLIGHVGYWGYSFKTQTLGEERASRLDRCNSALRYGLKYTVHSDNSVSPLGVLRMMEQSISRYMEGAPKEAEEKILNKSECVTPIEALRAATIDAAWQCHMEDKIGSLSVGKLADFVLLEQSPLTYTSNNPENPVAGMRDIPVLCTWKGGTSFKY